MRFYPKIEETADGFEDDSSCESSIPPPPPPYPTSSKRSGLSGLFRPRDESVGMDLPRQAYMIEETDSIEAVDASFWPAYWNNWFGSLAPGACARRRQDRSSNGGSPRCRRIACITILLLFCAFVALAVGVSRNNANNGGSVNTSAAKAEIFTGGDDNSTAAPSIDETATAAPVVAEYTAPTAAPNAQVEAPVAAPVASPVASPVAAPVAEDCEDYVSTDSDWYSTSDNIKVDFASCDATQGDWIAIYDATKQMHPNFLGDNHVMWLYTCNSQHVTDCEPVTEDTIVFGGGLPAGTYRVYLVRFGTQAPYQSFAISDEFEVED